MFFSVFGILSLEISRNSRRTYSRQPKYGYSQIQRAKLRVLMSRRFPRIFCETWCVSKNKRIFLLIYKYLTIEKLFENIFKFLGILWEFSVWEEKILISSHSWKSKINYRKLLINLRKLDNFIINLYRLTN